MKGVGYRSWGKKDSDVGFLYKPLPMVFFCLGVVWGLGPRVFGARGRVGSSISSLYLQEFKL